jgi:predicted O-linked N-acetylglucosamine transferase (SPINDLY family)
MSLQDQIQHHLARGELSAARPLLERAARTSADPQLLFAYARVLYTLGEREPAAYQASRALTIALNSPQEPQLRIVVGELIQDCGKAKDAIRVFRDGASRFPILSTLRAGLINALRANHQSGEAGDEALRALADFPNDLLLHLIGAGALGDSLRQSQARAALLRALSLAPADPRALIPAATMLHYCDGIEPAQLTDIHRRAGQALANSVGPQWQPSNWDFAPDRRLKVALVSSDFRDHAVARFLLPWLTHRDRSQFEYIAVTLRGPDDEMTAKLKPLIDHWIDATNKPDDQIATQIRAARPDIAIDLAGLHVTARPALFAKRLAPIQVTYLSYAGTTGIPAMDFRIVDANTDPTGSDSLATEKLERIPGCFLCFSPDSRAPVSSSSAAPGTLTFCSFNAQQKITDTTLDLWSSVLRAVPHAKLLLKSRTLADPRTREILNAAFAARSIDPSRINVAPHAPDYRSHLGEYNRADIALDTHPYCGTTTTCEALHMGIPVITLAGNSHASRVGASLLAAAGLPDCIAQSPRDFATIAANHAAEITPRDTAARAEAKQSLRAKFIASSLCNGPDFAKQMDAALRTIWKSHTQAPE